MKIDKELKESIYDLVCGNLRCEVVAAPESRFIADEFTDGSLCAQAYDRMLAAYSRLCRRLGVAEWEDSDVEDIINELNAIGKHIALKMFDYGVALGSGKPPPLP